MLINIRHSWRPLAPDSQQWRPPTKAQGAGAEGQPGAKRLTPITVDEREIPVGAHQQCVYESL